MRYLARFGAAATAIILSVMTPAQADERYFLSHRPAQPSIAQLSAEWWQLVLSVPLTGNPLNDATGSQCALGQHDPVWFLFGVTSGTATRTCTIPQGEPLFVVVYNNVEINAPNCGQPPETASEAMATVTAATNGATGLHVTLDNTHLDGLIVRRASPAFAVVLPDSNLFGSAACGSGVPAGVYSPAAADGDYLLLPPLSVGKHKLIIQANDFPKNPNGLSVTYNLTIAPVSLGSVRISVFIEADP